MAGASNTNNEIVRRKLELDKICRACLEIKRDMIPLFDCLTAAMLMAITKVEMAEGDGLPSQLCLQCVLIISRCHSFKLLIEKNDTILREHIRFLAEEQLKREQQETKEHRPLSKCSVFSDEVTMDHEGCSLDHGIKTEEMDLEPDYIEFNTDVDTDMTDMDEETENCDTNCELYDNEQTDPLLKVPSDEISQQNIDDSQDKQITGIKSEIDTNDEESGSELRKLHESEADTVVHKSDTEHVNNLHISDICNESRPSARSLTRHTTEKHASPTIPNTTHKQQATETYSCSKCAYRCVKQSTLTRHNMETHGGKVYSCELCDYRGNSKYNLQSHMRIHADEKPFSCIDCGYKTTRKANLIRHISTHTDEKLFSCDICGYKTSYKYSLIAHISKKHTGVKPFSCSICDFKCAILRQLNMHMKKEHNKGPHGGKIHSCELCGYRSDTKGSIKSHMTTHSGERPFSCNMCDYKSKRKCALTRHISSTHATEKLFACNICDYKSTLKYYLTQHMGKHYKPFTCDACKRKFSTKPTLIKHIRTHTGGKGFFCNICHCEFKKKRFLNIHIKAKNH